MDSTTKYICTYLNIFQVHCLNNADKKDSQKKKEVNEGIIYIVILCIIKTISIFNIQILCINIHKKSYIYPPVIIQLKRILCGRRLMNFNHFLFIYFLLLFSYTKKSCLKYLFIKICILFYVYVVSIKKKKFINRFKFVINICTKIIIKTFKSCFVSFCVCLK